MVLTIKIRYKNNKKVIKTIMIFKNNQKKFCQLPTILMQKLKKNLNKKQNIFQKSFSKKIIKYLMILSTKKKVDNLMTYNIKLDKDLTK